MEDASESASKRQKLSCATELKFFQPPKANSLHELINAIHKNTKSPGKSSQADREAAVGILHYANFTHKDAFSGILKKRYFSGVLNQKVPFHLSENKFTTLLLKFFFS